MERDLAQTIDREAKAIRDALNDLAGADVSITTALRIADFAKRRADAIIDALHDAHPEHF